MRRVDSNSGLGGSNGGARPRSGSLTGTTRDGLRPQSSRMRRDSLEREFAAMLANLSQDPSGGPPKPLPRPPASIVALSATLSNTLRSTTGGPAIRDALAATAASTTISSSSTITRQAPPGSSNVTSKRMAASTSTSAPSLPTRSLPTSAALRGSGSANASPSSAAAASRPASGRFSPVNGGSGGTGSGPRPASVSMGSSGRSRGGSSSSPGGSRGSSPTNRGSFGATAAVLSTSTGSLQQPPPQQQQRRPSSGSFGSGRFSPPLYAAAGVKRVGPGAAAGAGMGPGRPASGVQLGRPPSPPIAAGNSSDDSSGLAAPGSPNATPRSVVSAVSSLGMATPVSSAAWYNQLQQQQQQQQVPLSQQQQQQMMMMMMQAPPSMLTAYLPGEEGESLDETIDDDVQSVSTAGGSSVAGAGATTSSQRTGGSSSERIQVCVRVKPLDMARDDECAWMWQDSVITQTVFPPWEAKSLYRQASGRAQISYGFDHLFTPTHSTLDIYDEALRGLVRSSLDGVHATVFAYGQTATGKTHTLQGTSVSPGVIPLAVYDCFASLPKDRAFRFKVSYLEIYNEQLRDLLCPSTPAARIQVMEDKRTGATVKGLKEEDVYSPAEALALIAQGEEQRHVGATELNAESSRSHTIFRLLIESRPFEGVGPLRSSILSLIDLAGSENAKLTNATGGRQREGNYINKSLLALGHVIQKLSEASSRGSIRGGENATHVPFRDSKLTRFLQPALEGNALIAVICSISASVNCLDETHNTLKFASRAKRIRVRAEVNETLDEGALIAKYKEEITVLREQLSRAATLTNSPRRGINPPSSLVACLNSLDSIIGRAGAAGRHEQQQDDGPGVGKGRNDDVLVRELQRLKDDLVVFSATAATGAPALRTAASASGSGNPPPALPLSPPGPASDTPPSLAATAVAGGGKTLSLGGGGGGGGEDNPLHSQIRDLRTRLEQKEVTEYLIHADRNFLQQLVMEREAMLAEITAVVEEVDERQRALETYITELAEENARLRAQQRPSSMVNFRRLNSTPEPTLRRGGPTHHAGGTTTTPTSSSSPPSLRAASGGSASLSVPAPFSAAAAASPILDLPSTVREEGEETGEGKEQEGQDDFEQELLAHRRHLLSQQAHQQVVFKPAAIEESLARDKAATAAGEQQP